MPAVPRVEAAQQRMGGGVGRGRGREACGVGVAATYRFLDGAHALLHIGAPTERPHHFAGYSGLTSQIIFIVVS